MEKIYAPVKTTHKLDVLVEDVQVAGQHNITDLGTAVFDTFGIKLTDATSMQATKSSDTALRVLVAPGFGITSTGKIIKITSQAYKDLDAVTANYTVNFYVKFAAAVSDTISLTTGNIVNGTTQTMPYREINSYSFVAQATTVAAPADSFLLATVTVANHVITTVADKRYTNILAAYSLVTDITVDNGTIAGKTFITAPPALPKPMNLRITDMDVSHRKADLRTASFLPLLAADDSSSDVKVSLKWGWDDLSGGHTYLNDVDIFTISTTANQTWAVDALVGAHLFIEAGVGYDYVITANDAANADGALCNITTTPYKHLKTVHELVPIEADQLKVTFPAVIHYNAQYYEIVATPTIDGFPVSDVIEAVSYTPDNYLPKCEGSLIIPAGYTVQIDVRGYNMGIKSAWTRLTSGSYKKPAGMGWRTDLINYAVPVLIQIADISLDNSSVNVIGEDTGFRVNVYGWTAATDFEVAYNNLDPALDVQGFNTNSQKIITKQREVAIPVTKYGTYWVRTRPLICNQAVADPLTSAISVGTGSGGTLETIIGNYPINLMAYSGKITSYSAPYFFIEIASFKTLYNDTVVPALPTSIVNNLMTINGVDYKIMSVNGWNVVLADMAGVQITNTNIPNNSVFTIGTSEKARLINKISIGTIKVTRAALTIYRKYGSAYGSNIRVYQEGSASSAANIIVPANSTENSVLTPALNVSLTGGLLIIDGYDDTDSRILLSNRSALSGNITLFAKASA